MITDSTLTLQSYNGKVKRVLRGFTYTVVYDAYAGSSIITPNNNGEITNEGVGITISGAPTANVRVSIELPDHLVNRTGNSMAINFPSSGPGSGVREETGAFFNPNTVNTFNLGGGGVCGLRLGLIFTVPANVPVQDTFTGTIRYNVSYSPPGENTFTISDTIESTLKIITASLKLDIHGIAGNIFNLSAGNMYNISYENQTSSSSILPNINGEFVDPSIGVTITGSVLSNIVVELILPNTAIDASGHVISIGFLSRSGVRAETGRPFNPKVTNTFQLSQAGTVSLKIGSTIFVPPNTPQGTYIAAIHCVSYYTGLLKREREISENYGNSYIIIQVGSHVSQLSGNTIHNSQVSNVQQGNAYTIHPYSGFGTSVIQPSSNNERIDSSLGIDIIGEKYSKASILFELPTMLFDSNWNSIPITFSSSGTLSGIDVETGNLFDPAVPNLFSLGESGQLKLRMGYKISVPDDVPSGIYSGMIEVHAINPGFSKSFEEISSLIGRAIQIRVAVGLSFPHENPNIPIIYLAQNVPNPFNPGTEISFSVFVPATVDLSIYNVLGEKVETLFSGELPAGDYSKTWNASSFPSGVYFYKLQSGNISAIKKLMVIK